MRHQPLHLRAATRRLQPAKFTDSTMHYRFASDSHVEEGDNPVPCVDSQEAETERGFLNMMFGENEGATAHNDSTKTDIVQEDRVQDMEPEPATKKRSRVTKQQPKKATTKKRATKSKTNPIDLGESSDEEEGNKRGPNWKEHWIVNLVHLRGTMHEKFSGMKKQGVDNWGVLHAHLVVACPDFDRSSDACRKKWKKIYDDCKSDYTANGVSGSERASKCKHYALVDSYMHDRANVLKHVHANATEEDPNIVEQEVQVEQHDTTVVPEPTASTSQVHGKKKTDKLATQQAIAIMAEQAVKLTTAVTDSEAAKLNLLQGMLATMNELVKKL